MPFHTRLSHQKDKITIVAEIFPDADLLADKGIKDLQEYFEDQVKILNSKMPSYKAVKRVKLRDVEFQKNTSRKITRFYNVGLTGTMVPSGLKYIGSMQVSRL